MKYILIFIALYSMSGWGSSTIHRCTLLPVTDSVKGAVGYKVFEKVEEILKQEEWCTYISNSAMVSVFSRYRDNLPRYLKNEEVLKTVAEKLRVGSLIYIGLKSELDGQEVELLVYGENGQDIYLAEKQIIKSDQVSDIVSIIKRWLKIYKKMIPYDGVVSGVLGDQVTLEFTKNITVQNGQGFIVSRLEEKRKHPLLKKVVDWKQATIGSGNIFNTSENQALGIMKTYSSRKKVDAGDWVRLKKVTMKDESFKKIKQDEPEKPGTLGVVSVGFFISGSNVENSVPSGSQQMSGNVFGADFRLEGWITRQYFASLEIDRGVGTLRKSLGSPQKSSLTSNMSSFKVTGGYKYLPIGFFYGPQIDLYAGYGNYGYDLSVSTVDGFGKNNFTGILLGTSFNIPIGRTYRAFARAELMPFPSFSEEGQVYGAVNSVASMELEIGAKYNYTQKMSIDGSFETTSRKARFDGNYKEISFKDNRLKFGVSFNF